MPCRCHGPNIIGTPTLGCCGRWRIGTMDPPCMFFIPSILLRFSLPLLSFMGLLLCQCSLFCSLFRNTSFIDIRAFCLVFSRCSLNVTLFTPSTNHHKITQADLRQPTLTPPRLRLPPESSLKPSSNSTQNFDGPECLKPSVRPTSAHLAPNLAQLDELETQDPTR